jgi:hypothetical protein
MRCWRYRADVSDVQPDEILDWAADLGELHLLVNNTGGNVTGGAAMAKTSGAAAFPRQHSELHSSYAEVRIRCWSKHPASRAS